MEHVIHAPQGQPEPVPVEDGTAMNSYSSPARLRWSPRPGGPAPALRVTLKMFDEMAADETGSARDQDVHAGSSWAGGGEIKPPVSRTGGRTLSGDSRRNMG